MGYYSYTPFLPFDDVRWIPLNCSWSKITPSPLIFDFSFCFVFMLILGLVMLGKSKVCPAGLEERFSYGPAGDRIRKKRKINNKGGGITRESRFFSFLGHTMNFVWMYIFFCFICLEMFSYSFILLTYIFFHQNVSMLILKTLELNKKQF